ncbi:hypothetical protein [Mycobacterium asiaticum]|uniref:DUF7937 domain-containing protein n=1 Tax=Mycobacterium asiaticum TaxID=1790 RepID=UPI003F5C4EB4
MGGRQSPPGPPAAETPSADHTARTRNYRRDLLAAALLVAALLFPWNLHFGYRVPGSSLLLWAVLAVVTLLSLVSLPASRARPGPNRWLRLGLNIPYLLLVLAFVAYDAVQSVLLGGTAEVAGGVGPGGWLGAAGAVLAAQPLLVRPTVEEQSHRGWLLAARVVGYASMFGASLSTGFNLCWQIRYGLRHTGGSEAFGIHNTTVILTAVVYGVVALTTLLVASRWLLRNTPASRLATVALGASSLLAGMLVWVLPVGRSLDAFHGIAQNTPLAGVGYEGYLAWAAAAALFLPLTVFGSPLVRKDRDVWRDAVRMALTLIIVWCVGSVLMRVVDIVAPLLVDYPRYPYNFTTLAVFSAATAGLAWWLRARLASGALRSRLTTTLSGLVFTLAVSRVILGVLLAPRFVQGAANNPVYGNDLAQQINSMFDVTLCALALCIFPAVIIAGVIRKPRRRQRRQQPMPHPGSGPRRQVPIPTRPGRPAPPSEASTTQFSAAPAEHDADTPVLSGQSRSPRIFRSDETTGPLRPKIYRPPNRSS